MKQEEKQLLLKDLCARLPYRVKVKSSRRRSLVTLSLDVMTDFHLGCSVKPYLRPLSSMTDEKQKEFVGFHCVTLCPIIMKDCLTIENESNMFDWLNAHHFDYRNLIERGMAIKVTEENNPYKN